MIIGRLRIQSKRENINFRIRRSSIFLVNQICGLEPCLAISPRVESQKPPIKNDSPIIDNIFHCISKSYFIHLVSEFECLVKNAA